MTGCGESPWMATSPISWMLSVSQNRDKCYIASMIMAA
jgi:hypothetical protein